MHMAQFLKNPGITRFPPVKFCLLKVKQNLRCSLWNIKRLWFSFKNKIGCNSLKNITLTFCWYVLLFVKYQRLFNVSLWYHMNLLSIHRKHKYNINSSLGRKSVNRSNEGKIYDILIYTLTAFMTKYFVH